MSDPCLHTLSLPDALPICSPVLWTGSTSSSAAIISVSTDFRSMASALPAAATSASWNRTTSGPHIPTGAYRAPTSPRSEEHTYELQSLMRITYAVFCLKQKNTTQSQINQHDSI